MRMLKAVFASAFFLLLAAAQAPAPDPNCTDDRGVDRCAAEQQRRVLDLFQLPDIGRLQAAGTQVRRALYVDGYGRDVVAITFLRERGREPMLQVHFPRQPGQPVRAPLTAPVPASVWQNVLLRSENFERDFAPLPRQPNDPVEICLHSWVYTIEATDPAQSQGPPASLRRKTQDACGDSVAAGYARELQRAAIALIPHCAALDPAQHRNEASALQACAILSGDRLAAAEVLNRANDMRFIERPEDIARVAPLFDYRATLNWNGASPVTGPQGAARAWVANVTGGGRANLFISEVRGEASDSVRVTGFLSRSTEDASGESRYLRAPVEQRWTRKNGMFSIESATVGPFVPERLR